jgi:hypothetical protein
VINELETMCKEVFVAYFKVLSRNFPGGTEENYEVCQDILFPG